MKSLHLVIATLFVTPIFAADPPQKPGKVELQMEIRWGGAFARNPIKEFSNIPASYRTIPWHPDDDPTRNRTATIADATLNPKGMRLVNYVPAIGLTFYDRLTIRMAFDIQGASETKVGTGNDGIIRETEIHTFTFSRLVGDSLVYYAVPRPHWSSWPKLAPEAEIRIWNQVGILAGGWKRGFLYEIERGYDRYASMERLDKTPFMDVDMYHPYIGIRLAGLLDADEESRPFLGVVFTVGPMMMKSRFVPQAEGTRYSGKTRGVMFNVAFTFGGVVKKLVR